MDKEKQSGLDPTKLAQDKQAKLGWPTLGKILLSSALASFAVRGGLGLSKLMGRRVTTPDDPEKKKFKKLMAGQPGYQKFSSEVVKVAGIGDMDPMLFGPLSVLALTGGGYGGWKLADKWFDTRRKTELDAEIERKKKEYESLLSGSPLVQLRLPKTAECMEHHAALHENGTVKVAKNKGMDWGKAFPYLVYMALTGMVAGEAMDAYSKARGGSKIEGKLEAFESRPRRRTVPVRAAFSQPRVTKQEAVGSATKLPELTQTKLTSEEREEDPYRGT